MKTNFNENELDINVEQHEARLCELWPQTREGLELLILLIANPIAKIILTTVKSAGDAIVRRVSN